jgi:hypothetical protein
MRVAASESLIAQPLGGLELALAYGSNDPGHFKSFQQWPNLADVAYD